MLGARRALGSQIAPPQYFQPTERWADGEYLYLLDGYQGICKRTPIHWKIKGGTAYYQVIHYAQTQTDLPQNLEIRLARRRRFLPRFATAGLTTAFLVGAFLLLYPYLPEATYQVRQSLPHHVDVQAATSAPVSAVNKLTIPKIGVSASVLESDSLKILDKEEGVWHQTGNVKDGNLVLAGHRFKYLPPNSTTFYNLGKLTTGDVVILDWQSQRYVYVVREVRTVPATEVGVLKQDGMGRLTLYTCNDKKETQRIVVTADPLP